MGSYDRNDVYSKIVSLEDKVNRLEEIISFGNRGDYSSSPSHYNGGSPPHYKSAVRLSKATQNFKQDLLENPRHNKLSRENYQQIYNRVSVLEKELNYIIQNMNFERSQRSDYSYYSNMKSQSYCDDSQYLRGRDIRPKSCIKREPQRKQVTYDKYIELIPSDTSSSESIEEIIYYIESSTTTSSSSSVIVEEYVPKSYTRRSVRRAPIIDVSKSKPRPNVEKPPPKSKVRRKRKSAPEISVTKQPKVRKAKKEKRKDQAEEYDSESDEPNEKSEIFLVKRSKESPKNLKKSKHKEKKDKYFVSRLKRVESSDNGENNQNNNRKRASSEQKRLADKKVSKSEKGDSKHKGSKQRGKSNGSQTKVIKSMKSDKRKARKKPQSPKQSTGIITVARSSFILNDPFVRTIYYDDLDSLEEENKTSYSSNNDNSNYYRVKQDLRSNQSESGNFSQSNIHNASVYEMSNSIYSFDPFLKRKEKFYPADKLDEHSLSQGSNNISSGIKSRIHNVNKNDIIVLNDDKLKPHRQKFTFKQSKKSKYSNETVTNVKKEKNGIIDKKHLSGLEDDNNSLRALSPIAHSVYLTTVPVYQTSFHDFQLPAYTPKKSTNLVQSINKEENVSISLEMPSHHRSVLEDEIVMNVARKLSPVVAKIINTQYLNSKENFKTQRESSIKHSKTVSSSDNNLFYRNSTQSKVVDNNSNQNVVLPIIKGNKSKDHKKGNHNSRSGGNEIFIDVNNPSERNRIPEQNHTIYISSLKENSPLQQKSQLSIRKSALKKIKSISSMSSSFKMGSKKTSKHASMERQSGSLNRKSVAQQKRGSQISQKQPRGSQISQKQQRGSQINKKQRGSQINKTQQRGSQISLNQQRDSQINLNQQRGSQSSLKQQRGSQINKKQRGSQISLNQQQDSQISLNQQWGSQSSLKQQQGSQINKTQRGSQISPNQQQDSQISLNQHWGSQSSLKQQRGSQVSKNKRKGSQVNKNQQRDSQISLNQQRDSQISLNQQRGPQISLKQQRGSQISLNQQWDSQISLNQQRGSQISLKELRGSVSSQKQKVTSPRPILNSEGEEDGLSVTVPLQNFPSRSRAQSIQPKGSILNKSTSQNNKKKSVPHIKSILGRMKSREKMPKKTKEPTLISILSRMKSTVKSPKDFKPEPVYKPQVEVDLTEDSEQEQVILSIINGNRTSKYMTQDQYQEAHKQSKVNPMQDLEQEPALRTRINSNRTSKYMTQDQNQETRKQSIVNPMQDLQQEPALRTRMNSNRTSKYMTQDQNQETRKQSIVNPMQDLQQEPALRTRMNSNRTSKYMTQDQNQETRKQSEVNPMQDLDEQEPSLRTRMNSNRTSIYLTQDQNQEGRKQSEVNPMQDLDEQEPSLRTRMNSNRTSIYLTQDQNQETRKQSEVNPMQDLDEQEPALQTRMNSNRTSIYLTQDQNQETHKQSEVNPMQDLDEQEPSLRTRMNSNRTSIYLTQDQNQEGRKQSEGNTMQDLEQEARTQLTVNSSNVSVTGVTKPENNFDKLGASFNKSEVNRLIDNSDGKIMYSGSREFLKDIRSVSGYYGKPKSVVKDSNVERKESMLSQARPYQQVETMLVENLKDSSLVEEFNPEIIEPGQTDAEEIPLHDSSQNPRTIQELQHKPMKPLHFCIHFAKEKRSKFESQSTSSLDNILSSPCKKIYSSEDLSLSEYAFDKNTETYRYRKIHPKDPKQFFKHNVMLPTFLKGKDSDKYYDYFIKGEYSKSNCCCKTSKITKSEQLISDSSSYVDWHKVANEMKQAK